MPDTDRIAFVTGGTGFIGSHLVEALLARGYRVRALVRSEPKWLDRIDSVELVRGDLSDVEVLWEALAGVTHVFHLAGLTRAESEEAFERANVAATLNLLGAVRMAAPEVRRVLITSSLAAVGEQPEGGVADEETPLRPISRYGASKAHMERALREPLRDGTVYAEALPLTIVRPPAVYGPRERDIFTFFEAVDKRVCPIVGDGREPTLSLVHVQDLVDGMIAAAESERTEGETYFLGSEPAAYSWNEVKAATTEALGHGALTVAVPRFLVGTVGAVAELAGKLTGTYPPLNREKAREIRDATMICSSAKAQEHFGYAPQIALEDGIAETIAWYRTEGWL